MEKLLDVENVSITAEKISKKFDTINKVEVSQLQDNNANRIE